MCIDNDFIMKQQVMWDFTAHDTKWSLDYARNRNKVYPLHTLVDWQSNAIHMKWVYFFTAAFT